MAKVSVEQVDLAGKRVFLRVDFNVPLDGARITDDTRITAALPTVRHCLEAGASVILASHLGRPKGKPDPKYSLAAATRLAEPSVGRATVPDSSGPRSIAAHARSGASS